MSGNAIRRNLPNLRAIKAVDVRVKNSWNNSQRAAALRSVCITASMILRLRGRPLLPKSPLPAIGQRISSTTFPRFPANSIKKHNESFSHIPDAVSSASFDSATVDGVPVISDVVSLATKVGKALDNAGFRYAVGGALASGWWSTPRGTHDVDMNVFIAARDDIAKVLLTLDANVGVEGDDINR